MILSDDSRICRTKYRLTHSRSHATHHNHEHDGAGIARKHCCNAEECNAEDDNLRTAQTVGEVARKRYGECEEEVEAGRYKAHCGIRSAEILLDVRQDGVKYLAVGLIQEIGNPQQEDDLPFVGFGIDVYSHKKLDYIDKDRKNF